MGKPSPILDRVVAEVTKEGWRTEEFRQVIAVYPLNDTIAHDVENQACVCGPYVRFGDSEQGFYQRYRKQMVIHQAADGRA